MVHLKSKEILKERKREKEERERRKKEMEFELHFQKVFFKPTLVIKNKKIALKIYTRSYEVRAGGARRSKYGTWRKGGKGTRYKVKG